MRTGPPPKPTALRVLQGNPANRPLPEGEAKPEPVVESLEPPLPLNENGLRVWNLLVPMLSRLGLLTECDTRILARYCDMLVRWVNARDFIEERGETYIKYEYYNEQVLDANGDATNKWERKKRPKDVRPYPQVQTYMQASRELIRLENELGLTPSARTRINVEIFGKPKSTDQSKPESFEGYLARNKRKPLAK